MKKLFKRILDFWRIITLILIGVLVYYFFIYEPPKSNLRKATKEDLFNVEEIIQINDNGDTVIVEVWSNGEN